MNSHVKTTPVEADYAGHIDYLEHTIGLASNNEMLLRGLADFYAPYYLLKPTAPDHPDVTVTCLVDPTASTIQAPVGDMRVYRARPQTETTSNQRRVFRRHDVDIEIVVDDKASQIVIAGSSAQEVELQARVLVRDQLLHQIEYAAGSVRFHAAAAAHDGRGVAAIGDRNVGKTTTLLTLMSALHYDFVTADRLCLLQQADSSPLMCGVPARANMHAISFQDGEVLAGLRDGTDWNNAVDNKVLVDIEALTAHLGVGITPSVRLNTVILPQLTANGTAEHTEVITDPDRARELLREHVMEGAAENNTHKRWLDYRLADRDRLPTALNTLLVTVGELCRVIRFTGTRPDYVAWLTRTFR